MGSTLGLDHQIRLVLARLELVSHGSTQAWNPSGGQSGLPDDAMVARVERPETPPHVRYRRLYEGAVDDDRRRKVIASAQSELERITRRSPVRSAPALSDREILERRVLECDGWSAEEVARSLRTSVGTVRRIRVRDGRDGENGAKVLEAGAQEDDRRERARELLARGMTERQVAMLSGLSQATVHRLSRPT